MNGSRCHDTHAKFGSILAARLDAPEIGPGGALVRVLLGAPLTTMSAEQPVITVTDAAAEALRAALAEDHSGDPAHLTIDADFQNDLFVGPLEPGEIVITTNGVSLAMDASSAQRASGLILDFVTVGSSSGFKVENPNEAMVIEGVRPADLLKWLDRGAALELVDVRSEQEHAKASLDRARRLDAAYEEALLAMPKTQKIVFMAHHSRGGLAAAERFVKLGFEDVVYVVGGIDAFSTWDPSIPRY